MSVSNGAPRRASTQLIIGFLDLARFTLAARRLADEELADALDEFYRLAGQAIDASGGSVVKFLGDGALASWPEDAADAALGAMTVLRGQVDEWSRRWSFDTTLVARLHCGPVVEGQFGPESRQDRDVIGRAVFVAARLEARSISVSAEFFRKLSPESRRGLKKHSPPVVYIPSDDPRP